MKQLETRITIESTPEKIWEVLTAFDDYSDWNPFVTSIAGNPSIGESLSVNIEMEKGKPQTFKPTVLANESSKEFRWKGKLFVQGLFDGEHYFQLNQIDGNTTEFIHGEKFSGVLVAPIMSLIANKTAAGFKAMNQALKTRVEQSN